MMDFLNNQSNYTYPNGYYNYNVAQQPQSNFNTLDANQAFSGIFTVNGEYAARNFPIARGVRVLLMDTQNDVFYVKSADLNGMVNSFRTFDYVERTDVSMQNSSDSDTAPADKKASDDEPAASYVTKKDLTASVNRIMDYIDSKVGNRGEKKK